MLYKQDKVSTGIRFLDKILNGGFETDTLTTIYGPAGSGKTNICMIFANSVARNGKVIYIDTEKGFSVERLSQINSNYESLMQRIIFLNPKTFEEQQKAIDLLDELISEDVKAIVFDSIALLYRLELGKSKNVYEINRGLGIQLQKLSNLANEKHIPIILTTQVYSDFNKEHEFKLIGGDILSYISKTMIEVGFPKVRVPNVRYLKLVKHRSLPETQEYFIITEKGIFPYSRRSKK
ncbi:MAG: repair protein RadB [Candidatus Woesearchaeota archaeon]|nr:repair protein RadB [Candidatus Woesearchaeota archaeon]MDN5327479.1 repair protein RadB [Candidatus Woesearchaeota archaeon]